MTLEQMTDAQLAAVHKIRTAIGELNSALGAAASSGLNIEIDTHRMDTIGRPAFQLIVNAKATFPDIMI